MPEHNEKMSHEKVLEQIAEAIDIPTEKDEEARAHFQSLGEWLERDESELADYDPHIAPQGSFLLGTANRPIGVDENYDVDIICKLDASKTEFTQSQLKAMVGREVIAYAKSHNMKHQPEDKRRCWTLEYDKKTKFHIDVLPCLPDTENYRKMLTKQGFVELAKNESMTADALAITDNMLPNYYVSSDDWPSSNPIGYAAWFKEQMAERLRIRKIELAESMGTMAKVDEIPDHKVKTTLQKSIQILKRHRDNMFVDDLDNKPISIIINSLAAHAYDNEGTLTEALSSILTNMDRYIEIKEGVKWVRNPVNPAENFADRWVENPQLEKNFNDWLAAARKDFGAYVNTSAATDVPIELRKRMGETIVAEALKTAAATTIAVKSIPAAAKVQDAVSRVYDRGSGTSPWCYNEFE